jgi:sarcosine oxidase
MGSSAAWQLARRGREVTLVERFGPGHTQGASHGASRNFNLSYADDTYLSLLREALPLWRELEDETGVAVLDQVGLANHGANPAFDAVASALPNYGFDASFLTTEEAGERWPGIRFDTRVLFTPQAGRLNADAAVSALQRAATARGAVVRHHSRVVAIRVVSENSVHVDVQPVDAESGEASGALETVDARRVVVTLGAWTSKLIGSSVRLPSLVVSQEQPAHFAVRDSSLVWPGFNHAPTPGDRAYDYWYSPVYGMFTPGHGVKAGWHGTGAVLDPDARTFVAEPAQRAALQRYAREWLPGADPETLVEISCTYTTTPDSNFVLDSAGPLVIGAGFSGHGFKFTPSIGRMLADVADGTAAAPALFSLAAVR